jgi:hypothetical protein
MEATLSDWRIMVSLYTLLLIYASFPVALFWDETRRPTAKPPRPDADGSESSPQGS